MFSITNNPVRDAEAYQREQGKEISKLPVCTECDEHIQQEEAVNIYGEWYCDDCIESFKRVF